jgi:hypothetical protein
MCYPCLKFNIFFEKNHEVETQNFVSLRSQNKQKKHPKIGALKLENYLYAFLRISTI